MRSQKTKAKILSVAADLFNEHGTQAISTNHIAKAAQISPGNLYYHFRNKEEIICAMLEEFFQGMNEAWLPKYPSPLKALRAAASSLMFNMWEYRFFQRELIILLQKNPELKARYQSIYQQRKKDIGAFFQRLIDAGLMRKPDDISLLIKITWLINGFWFSFLEIEGRIIDKKSVQEAFDLIILVLKPYLTDEALSELQETSNISNIPDTI